MRNSRLIGGKPKIGIRPIIDGRRGGIRESLEDMTMGMAHKVAELYSSVLRHSDGTSVECIIADTTIGGVAEAAMAAEKFRNSGVGVVLSVTPCWCYGFETIDMDGEMPKAIWGFNGTERPGAVYLASALASHTQKGLPTFGIYGRDVQEVTDMEIPEDVQEKLLRFARAGIAVATMKGKSYLSIGSVSMGIAGSIPNPDFFQEYLGMRNEYVDASEIERRVQLGIYDHEEFARAMAWTEKYCKSNEGTDFNPEHLVYSREEKDARWEYVVKMTVYHRCEMVYADAFCLREVLGNLLDNAIKYSHEEVKIDIICESEKGFCKIKVCDNGLGIPLKDQSLIFNRFERSAAVGRSGRGGAAGFGLGLNYVQQVMLAHGGRVEVESEEGCFSEFTLYFPIETV